MKNQKKKKRTKKTKQKKNRQNKFDLFQSASNFSHSICEPFQREIDDDEILVIFHFNTIERNCTKCFTHTLFANILKVQLAFKPQPLNICLILLC